LIYNNVESFAIGGETVLFSIGSRYFIYYENNLEEYSLDEPIVQVALNTTGAIRTKTKIYVVHSMAKSLYAEKQRIEEFTIADFTSEEILDMKAGAYHVVLLTASGKVFTHGAVAHGQCGREYEVDDFGNTVGFGQVLLPKVVQIDTGRLFTFCLVDSRTLYAFGVNNYHQLGIGQESRTVTLPTLCDLTNVLGNVLSVHCGGFEAIIRTSTFDLQNSQKPMEIMV
jgi:alpha-tubulin suppressor-like RCC1 family protein